LLTRLDADSENGSGFQMVNLLTHLDPESDSGALALAWIGVVGSGSEMVNLLTDMDLG